MNDEEHDEAEDGVWPSIYWSVICYYATLQILCLDDSNYKVNYRIEFMLPVVAALIVWQLSTS